MYDIKVALGYYEERARQNLFNITCPGLAGRHGEDEFLLMEQMSIEEMNAYLYSRAYDIRKRFSKAFSGDSVEDWHELFVLVGHETESSYECEYAFGEELLNPHYLKLPTIKELHDEWEFFLRLPKNDNWVDFQRFVDKKIFRALSLLQKYEDIFKGEIISLKYVLISFEGEEIHKALSVLAWQSYKTAFETGESLKKNDAPHTLLVNNFWELCLARRAIVSLGIQKPRYVTV